MKVNPPHDAEILLEDPLVVELWKLFWGPYLQAGGNPDALPQEGVSQFWGEVFPTMLADPETPHLLRVGWAEQAAAAWDSRCAADNAFGERLERVWGDGLRLLDELLWLAERLLDLNQWRTRRAARPETPNWPPRAQLVLLARGIQTCHEVRVLLRSGFASGAWGRWRTLHEISVVAKFVSETGPIVAEGYMLHNDLQSLRLVRAYSRHSPTWRGREGAPDAERSLQKRARDLGRRYGAQFGTDFGWAIPGLTGKSFGPAGPSFGVLEAAVGLSVLHPAYVKANHAVHSSVRGFTDNPGHPVWPPETLLHGPSEYGLEQPAGLMAHSLVTTVAASLGSTPLPSQTFHVAAMVAVRDKASDAFQVASDRLRAHPPANDTRD